LIKLEFPDGVLKNLQISNLIKVCPVETELFHANRWKEDEQMGRHDKANIHFCNIVNAPKN